MALRALHLCSGYGGFELALRPWGVVSACHVEWEAHAAAVLVARMADQTLDQAPVWSDLTTFDGGAWRGRVDLVTAGFPCQPFSSAGQRRGVDDDRWLWPWISRVLADVGPRWVVLENVPQLVRLGLPHVLADLAALGFNAEWGLFSAASRESPDLQDVVKRTASRLAPTTTPDGPSGSPTADLNPNFVESLMGLPDGWSNPLASLTGCTCSATDSSRSAPPKPCASCSTAQGGS